MAERLSPEALDSLAVEALVRPSHTTFHALIGALLDHVAALEEILRDVAQSAVEFEDPRVGYVTIQLDRDTWEQARALLTEPTR